MQQYPATTGERLGKGDHAVEFMNLDPLLLLVVTVLHQPPRHHHILRAKQQQRLGGESITSGASGLLIVALDILRQIVVNHKAHIGLVDPHTEGDRRHHHIDLIAHELLMHLFTGRCRQPGMVGGGVVPGQAQLLRQLLHSLATERIDDAALTTEATEEVLELIKRFALLQRPITDIGTVKTGDMHPWLTQLQPLQNILAGLWISSRSQRHHRNLAELPAQIPQLYIFGTEVMPPLRNTVGLIDRKQPDLDLLQPCQKPLRHQPLRSDIEQIQLSGMELCQRLTRHLTAHR